MEGLPATQHSVLPRFNPEDVDTMVSYYDLYPPVADSEHQIIEELIEEACRGAHYLTQMLRAIRSSSASVVTRPILFHDQLVECCDGLVSPAVCTNSNLSNLKVYEMADIRSQNYVEPCNQLIGSAVFVSPSAQVNDISLQNTNVDLATYAQDWEPIVEQDANLGFWGYEYLDPIEREENYGI